MRTNVKEMISISRANFFDSLEDNFLSNPKRFWSIFKLSSKKSRIPETMSLGKDDGYSTTVLSPKFAPYPPLLLSRKFLINDYFASVFNRTELEEHLSSPLLTSITPDHALSDISLTTEEVLNKLLALDPDKATLKETAQQIAPSLTELFNITQLWRFF
ncbi:Hypothetical predicted protein [Paramuricea clavata]|uniref:Uncharacterized protein n=1 Tax=Paramuricea clavata TaxID=317549 RepID=A0A7D9EY77_PARCT|nr:Hypothetical predicted protein [Paramuricea clavata]